MRSPDKAQSSIVATMRFNSWVDNVPIGRVAGMSRVLPNGNERVWRPWALG